MATMGGMRFDRMLRVSWGRKNLKGNRFWRARRSTSFSLTAQKKSIFGMRRIWRKEKVRRSKS